MNYLSEKETEILLNACNDNIRHKLIVLIMIDCGLRVSETISIKIKDFDFKKRILSIKSLKKRDKDLIRQIPISDRLYNLLADYIHSFKELKPEAYLFPSPVKKNFANGIEITPKHINRFSVYLMLQRRTKKYTTGIQKIHPHALRHTFATRHITADTPIHEIKTMLGHASLNTTLIYTHIPTQKLKGRIEKVNQKSKGFFPDFLTKTMRVIGLKKPDRLINFSFQNNQFTIGRTTELQQLFDNGNKGINTIIIGGIGTGKSHLIQAFKENFKNSFPSGKASEGRKDSTTQAGIKSPLRGAGGLLFFDDLDQLKETLAQTLLFLYKGDKEAVYKLLYDGLNYDEAYNKITRESVVNIALQLTKITQPKEYIILIDDVSKLTPKAVQILEKLKDHFTIITSAREVPIKKSSFLWNFDIIKLPNLNRPQSLELIYKLSSHLQTNDMNVLQNHIYDQTNGNPRAITEMIERYKKEPFVNANNIRTIKHHGALKEVDLTFIVILFLAVIAVMRYFASGLQNPNLRIIGGVGLIFLFISRYIFANTKRKFI